MQILIRAVANGIDVPLWVEQPNIDLKFCTYDRLYQDSIVIHNRWFTFTNIAPFTVLSVYFLFKLVHCLSCIDGFFTVSLLGWCSCNKMPWPFCVFGHSSLDACSQLLVFRLPSLNPMLVRLGHIHFMMSHVIQVYQTWLSVNVNFFVSVLASLSLLWMSDIVM